MEEMVSSGRTDGGDGRRRRSTGSSRVRRSVEDVIAESVGATSQRTGKIMYRINDPITKSHFFIY